MEKLVQFLRNLINEAGGLQVRCGNFLTMCLLCVQSQAHRDSIKNKEASPGTGFLAKEFCVWRGNNYREVHLGP